MIPGLASFLLPTDGSEFIEAGSCGPVVVINASPWRCDALAITDGRLDVIELSDLTFDEVMRQADTYLDTIQLFEFSMRPLLVAIKNFIAAKGAKTAADRIKRERAIFEEGKVKVEARLWSTLEWLWGAVADRVLSRLQLAQKIASEEPWTRLWWCPTGAFTLLPLHAASRRGVTGAAVLERVISSYTPTLRALLEVRKRAAGRSADMAPADKMLIIKPDLPGALPLQTAVKDISMLTTLLGSDRIALLQDQSATRENVASRMPNYRWIHFSGHGTQNLGEPWSGGLVLNDGILSIGDISRFATKCEFAFLAACKTATGGVQVTNEVITLASALHYTGCQHLVATLWSVWDEAAADLGSLFYSRLIDNGVLKASDTALALHEAVTTLRNANIDHPSVWMPFVHIGP
jgi:hypothetical protein